MSAYYDLGNYSRTISTRSAEAQQWFDRGILWSYGFNHEEAVRCFQAAVQSDPECAMAYWGIAYAIGPNYNKPWEAFDQADAVSCCGQAFDAVKKATALSSNATAVERELIDAIAQRYPSATPTDDMSAWNDAYAVAMRDVYQHHPQDLDVVTLFADALMNRTPWALWDLKTGKPADGADTTEVQTALEALMNGPQRDQAMRHAGVLHLYIHLMEMSPHPEAAIRAGDHLLELVPDAGHLVHMPTHIDVLCGHYANVVYRNTRAVAADHKFLDKEGALNFYSLYRCHNYHFILYGAMFLGQYQSAVDAANEMISTLPEELLKVESPPMADWTEGFISMKLHVYIRFGKWQEIIDEPMPRNTELYCVTTAMLHYAKGVAFASMGSVKDADAQQDLFNAALARVPESRYLFNNKCIDILAIAAEMLAGEIAYRKGEYETAFAHLRRSVALDDTLPYDEPWGWMQPTRHALGALLLEQNHVAQAEAVYRADLGLDATLARACQHPDNVWSLHGLHECLKKLGKNAEALLIKQRLDLANARADVPIKASCFCSGAAMAAA